MKRTLPTLIVLLLVLALLPIRSDAAVAAAPAADGPPCAMVMAMQHDEDGCAQPGCDGCVSCSLCAHCSGIMAIMAPAGGSAALAVTTRFIPFTTPIHSTSPPVDAPPPRRS
jgi:hypothetical protein